MRDRETEYATDARDGQSGEIGSNISGRIDGQQPYGRPEGDGPKPITMEGKVGTISSTNNNGDPAQSRAWQIAKGIFEIGGGVVGGALAIGVILAAGPEIAAATLIVSAVEVGLSYTAIGCGTATILDAGLKRKGEKLASIPGGFGDAVGQAFLGPKYGGLIGSVTEGALTGSFLPIDPEAATNGLNIGLHLGAFSSAIGGLEQSIVELMYNARHSSAVLPTAPMGAPYIGTRSVGGVAPSPY